LLDQLPDFALIEYSIVLGWFVWLALDLSCLFWVYGGQALLIKSRVVGKE
jgi:hypothetical protein